jgi:predicted transcriptional regulator
MRKKDKEIRQAIELRGEGKSLNEIAKALNVSKSSVSVWVRDVEKPNIDRQKYLENPKKCSSCNKELIFDKRKNKFCDLKCSAKFNAGKRKSKPKKKFSCLNCGKDVRNKFCNKDCQLEFNYKQRIEETKRTGMVQPHQATAKKVVIIMRGHSCEKCENTEWMGEPIPLVLDHINGKCKDWRLENLRLVCGNCDMQLPTYKSKNKNSQRKSRVGKY